MADDAPGDRERSEDGAPGDRERSDGDGASAGAATAATTAGDDAGTPDALEPLTGVVDRPAASAGFVVAAVALASAFLTWTAEAPLVRSVAGLGTTPGAVFAAVALAGFAARRYGLVERRPGAGVAGVGAAGYLLTAAARFLAPASGGGADPTVGTGLVVAAVVGPLALALAVADARGVPADGLVEMARRSVVGFALVVGAFIVVAVVAAPFRSLDLGPVVATATLVTVNDLVFVAVALGFLAVTGRGLAYVDLEMPGVRDLAYAGLGVVALVGVLVVVRLVTLGLDLPSTSNAVVESARDTPEVLLALIVLSFVAIAPAEELLNRNVIQKYLYGPFSRAGAVVVASGIFAAAHVFSYSGDSVVAMVVSLTSVFLLSLVLGVIYERTENILVPIAVHGFFNAAQFALLYVAIVAGEMPESAAVLPP
jgi:membrane protease YdiL (CAAX protease family)